MGDCGNSSEMPLAITWNRAEQADSATIQTRQLNPVTITDSRTYSLAMGSLKSKPDQTENEEIELVRSSLVAPAGAVAGSWFRVRIRNAVTVVVQPTQ